MKNNYPLVLPGKFRPTHHINTHNLILNYSLLGANTKVHTHKHPKDYNM